ncbi:MAG TPA: geranylgeranylglycerol-phosphate geranylgeranyltransferase [Candidatus Deferrimicrobium sp.]|nr:geranylgeranylglycerol-phosphate geranylgeranyltransferase [Candidatus Deferrimicrobium sp.]
MSRVIETLRLIRVVNCLMASVGVVVGAEMTWSRLTLWGPAAAAIAAFLICAAGNVVNDLRDVEIDRVNRPDRVLVRQTLSRRYAIALAVVADFVAVLLALLINLFVATTAVMVIAALLWYNMRLKRIPVAGNMIIAGLGGLTFITGGLAVDPAVALYLPGPIVPAVFAFLFHLVREVIKDIQDVEGDSHTGVRTLPQVIGVQKSLSVALSLFLILVLLTYVPIIAGWYGSYYKIITVYCVDLPLLLLLILLWGFPTPVMLKVTSLSLKAGMALGILALLAR